MSGIRRDSITRLTYAQLCVFGYFLYAFNPSVSLLREDQDISRGVSALHGTAYAAGGVVVGLLAPRLLRRIGRAAALKVGLIGMVVGILLFTCTTALPVTLFGALVGGAAGALMQNCTATVLSDHHGAGGPTAIAEANAVAAGVGVLAPLVVGAAAATALGWRVGLLLTVPFALVMLYRSRNEVLPAGDDSSREDEPGRRLPMAYWPAWGVTILCVAVEFSMTIWASDLLKQRAGASDGVAAAAVTAVVLGLSLGRTFGSRLTLKYSVETLLFGTFVVAAAGFAVFWISTVLWISVLGLFIVGTGLALQYPLGLARAIAASGGMPDAAAARASLGVGLSTGVAPFLLGSFADAFGTHRAYLLVPCLLACCALLLAFDRRRAERVTAVVV